MLGEVFKQIFDGGSAFVTWFVDIVKTLVSLFWETPSGEGTGKLTFIGSMAVIGLLIGLTKFAIGWVRSLMKH